MNDMAKTKASPGASWASNAYVAGGAFASLVLEACQRIVGWKPEDGLRIARAHHLHAIGWARHYNREGVALKKQGRHIESARAFVEKSYRMRLAHKYAAQAASLKARYRLAERGPALLGA